MPTISTADFKNGLGLRIKDKVYTIVEFQHVKPGKGGAFVRYKTRDIKSGRVVENTCNAGTKFESVMLTTREFQYLYNDGTDYIFMDNESYEQVPVPEDMVGEAKRFGKTLGIIFQIRDDIFDYYDSAEIGKPTGNDMAEGKLTLPVIYALKSTGDEEMLALARKVKEGTVSVGEIARLVEFTKANGGIEYAERRMQEMHAEAKTFLSSRVPDEMIRRALEAYLSYVIERTK